MPTQNLKQRWTAQEDTALCAAVGMDSHIRWTAVASRFAVLLGKDERTSRTSKQCRERWNNHLRPELKRTPWTEAEDLKLIDLYAKFGNRFTLIGRGLHRADIHVRNRIHSTKRMVARHRAGFSTSNSRKEGVLFKYFLGIDTSSSTTTTTTTATTNNNTNDALLFGFNEQFLGFNQGVQQDVIHINNTVKDEIVAHQQSQPLYKAAAPTELSLDQSQEWLAPQPDIQSSFVLMSPQPTIDIQSSFVLMSPPTKSMKPELWAETPGSWSNTFSFWGSSVSEFAEDFAVSTQQPLDDAFAWMPFLTSP